ncbi:hypothetical protein QT972_32160 [Microcoleus sp. herbarium7]|uniref:hypothetical protein n=1 Tax=Microcoleus sp. herbarium7 TaxID=3055435 RepID=UPI002FD5F7B9
MSWTDEEWWDEFIDGERWDKVIDGYLVKFEFDEVIGYCFKIYRDDEEVYDSDGLQDTEDRAWIVGAANRVIRDELASR